MTIAKRLLSLLLVLAIVIGFVPNVFASDNDIAPPDYEPTVTEEATEPTEEAAPEESEPAETEETIPEATEPETPVPEETDATEPTEAPTEPSEVTEPTEEPEPTDEATVVTEPETTEAPKPTEPVPTQPDTPRETQPMDEPIAPGKNEEEPPIEESIEEPTEPEEEIRDFAHGWLDIPFNGNSTQGISGTQAAGHLQYNGYIYFANSEKGVDWIKSYTLTNDYGQSISLTADIHAWEIKRLNGKVTYCIEPSNGSSDSLYYGSGSSLKPDENWGNYFNFELRNAIGLLMLYSQTHHPASLTSQDSIEWEVATQIILWELITGCRNAYHPYARTDSSLAAMYFARGDGCPEWEYATNQFAKLYSVSTYYNILANEMALHGVIPSFTKQYASQAPTHELPRQADGSYKLTLTDTNNVLSRYSFASASPITVSQSGNKLTLTAPKGSVVPSELTFKAEREMPNEDDPNYVLTVFVNHTHGMQDVIQPMTGSIPSDPVPAYFKAALQKSGTMTIKKTAANGDVASYKFRFYNAATSSLYYGVSDTDGRIYATDSSYKAGSKVYTYEDMKDGSYTFTEALSLTPDKRCWPDYVRVTVSDASGKVVQDTKLTGSQLTNVNGDCRTAYVDVVGLTDGGVLTVEFHNQPLPGTATLKKTTDYGPVDGYKFRLYNAADKSLVCGISDADGRIYQVGSDWQLTGAKNYIFDGLVDGTYDLREVITQSAHKDAFPDYVIVTVKDHDGKTVNSHRYEADSIINDKGDALIKGMVITGLSGEGTMELTIHNAAKPGTMTIKKTASNGDVEGYPFSVYNATALSGKTRFGKSDANGDVYRTDASYQAEDRDYEFRGMQDGTYSFREAITKAEHQNVFPDYWEITAWDADGNITYSHKFVGEEIANENGDAVLRNVAITGLTGGGRMEMEIHNVPQTAPVTIQKVADDGNVEGIPFDIEELMDGTYVYIGQKLTEAGGIIDLGEVPIGTQLRFTEIVPPGYEAEQEQQEITVVEGENIVTFVNHLMPLFGGLELCKIDPDDPEAILTGATFMVYSAEPAEGIPMVEDPEKPGYYRLEQLPFGTYTVKETEAPEGYALDETEYSVEITEAKTYTVAADGLNGVPNHQIPGTIKAKKVDPQGNPLPGVGFLLVYSLDEGETWNPVFTPQTEMGLVPGVCTSEGLSDGILYTDSEGIAEFTGLRRTYADKDILYRLTEASTLPGFEPLLDNAFCGPLPGADSGYTYVVTIVNNTVLKVPMSGGNGMIYMSIGICGLMVCAYLFITNHNKKRRFIMKNANRILSLFLAVILCCSMAIGVFAAEPTEPSLTIYKYNFTAAEAAGVAGLGSWVATGIADAEVESAMAPYTVQGVVFSYLKVGDFCYYSGVEAGVPVIMNMMEMPNNDTTAAFLSVLGLSASNAHHTADGNLYFDVTVIYDALKTASANTTALMDAAESFLEANGATAMPETNANGYTHSSMQEGIYIVAETSVPEYISNVTTPFIITLPLPAPDGSDNLVYDATIYPKNWADQPDLEKTLREDPGISTGTTNEYTHNATASVGDTINYHITSTLPQITSNVTRLTQYTYDDTLSAGLTYKGDGVTIEWFQDSNCTNKITSWTEDSGKFIVEYGEKDDSSTMQIRMSATGLAEINTSTAVYGSGSTYHGYSGCTMRISYNCVLDEDAVLGSAGNPNEVTLTWSRTNTNYWDTLEDDCHVYAYGITLRKEFTDAMGDFAKVKFTAYNETDGYYVVAEGGENGLYTVTGHTTDKKQATQFTPEGKGGMIYIRGLEDDTYLLTEEATDPDHMLLSAPVKIEITTQGNGISCPVCGEEGLVASAKINGDARDMQGDGESVSALVALTIKNVPVTKIVPTGDRGTMLYTIAGTIGLLLSAAFALRAFRKPQVQ